MFGNTISEELKRFIHSNIDSVEMLEILGFLCRNDGQAWSASEVADQLYLQTQSTQLRLAGLHGKRFCETVDADACRYRYDSTDAEQHRLVKELLEAYRVRRASVITLIFSKPDDVHLFSDAFRFRKDG